MAEWWLDLRRVALLWILLARYLGLPWLRRILRLKPDLQSIGVRLRRLCEHMRITYLKLGQYLAMRFDILDPAICNELAKLFDAVQPMPLAVVYAQIERELGRPLGEVFLSFDETPVGSASVAQVHRATARDGQQLAIKVQRPGIEEIFNADIRILRRLLSVLDALMPDNENKLVDAIDEFARFTLRELNFLIEGRTADRLRRTAMPYEYIPEIRWELSTKRMLVMEFVEGISVGRASALLEQGRDDELRALLPDADIDEMMQNFAFAVMRQLFVTGFFHGDPHPGNILFRNDGKVVFLDFGIFGALTPEELQTLSGFVENLSLGNIEEGYHHYSRLAQPTADSDMGAVKRELMAVLRRWYDASHDPRSSMEERHLGTYWGLIWGIFRKHRLKSSTDQLLFWRAMLVTNSTALRLAHRFDLLESMRQFFIRVRPGPVQRIAQIFWDAPRGYALAGLGVDGPCALEKGLAIGRGQESLQVRAAAVTRVRGAQATGARAGLLALLVPGLAIAAAALQPAPLAALIAAGGGAALLLAAVARTARLR